MDRQRRKFIGRQGRKEEERKEGWKEGIKSFQVEGNPCAKKKYCSENIRRYLINVQEFRMNWDTAHEEKGMELRIMKGLK